MHSGGEAFRRSREGLEPYYIRTETAGVRVCVSYMQAGVVGEQPVVTQRHVLLLPLLVEGFPAPLQQHSLQHSSNSN